MRGIVALVGRIAGYGLAILLLAAGSSPARAGDVCVWTGQGSDAVGRFLHQWVQERQGGTLERWDVGISDQDAQIELRTSGGLYRMALTLGGSCDAPPSVRLQSGSHTGGFPTDADLAALAADFPAERRVQSGGLQPRDGGPGPLTIPFALLALLCAALVAAPETRTSAAARYALVLALVVVAAWPLLFLPFDTDAPIIRAAVTATNIYGDAFHPFLPFFFYRPVTWFSIEPWALRLVPLAFLGVETLLLMLAARREGGIAAAVLAGIWFAAEARRRHGLWDLSDWDVAGTFLVALLLTLQRPWATRWFGAVLIAALMAAGLASSYLMIIPAGLVLGCLGIEMLRGRCSVVSVAIVGATFLWLALVALRIFTAGSSVTPEINADTLWQQMYLELPLARNLVMALPLLLGLVWLARNVDRLAPRFALLCLVVVPVAVVIAHRKSHVAGGYYIGLVTPLLLYAAAAGTVAAAAAAIAAWRAGGIAGSGVRAAVVVGLVALTVVATAPGRTAGDVNFMIAVAHETRGNDLPIYTNRNDLARLLAFERARAGDDPLTIDAALWGPKDLLGRIKMVADDSCPPPANDGHGFFVAIFRGSPTQRRCLEALAQGCRILGPSTTLAFTRDWIMLRCGEPAPPS